MALPMVCILSNTLSGTKYAINAIVPINRTLTKAPSSADFEIKVVNAKVAANISIDLPTSPIILTFSSFS